MNNKPAYRPRPNDPEPSPDPARWRILAVLLATIFMSLIGVSIVNVALPSMQLSLGATQSDIQWVLSGYALTFGVILVAAGRAGDLMGRGGIFLLGVGLFTAASIAAGLAPDARWLNAARFVQGVGSGLLNPQGLGMIQQYFRGAERGRAFGYFGTMVGFSVAIGPVLGGVLIELGGTDLGWRLTFLVNVPIGLLVLFLGFRWFPRPLIHGLVPASTGQGKKRARGGWRSLDPIGSALLGLAVLTILFPFVESRTSPLTWLLLPIGLMLTAVWVVWERHMSRQGLSPMVDLEIFSTSSFTNGVLIMSLYFLGMTSIWVLVALYVQEGLGMSALESGLVSVWWLMLTLSFVGLAQGSVISPNQTLTLMDVPLDYAGSSGAIMQTGQRIGTSVGIAMITAAVFGSLSLTSWPQATMIGFGFISLVILLALAVAWKDQRDRTRMAGRQPGR